MATQGERITIFAAEEEEEGFRFLDTKKTQYLHDVDAQQVAENLRKFVNSLNTIVPAEGETSGDLLLKEFSVAVALNAKGKVGFLGTGAEAGASATFSLKFVR